MKKLSKRHRKWLNHRCRKKQRRVVARTRRSHGGVVSAWLGDDFVNVLIRERPRQPPSVICFRQNPDETLKFLADLREGIAHRVGSVQKAEWIKPPRRKHGLPWMRTYVDYSKIEFISTAASVVMAAEYDRAARLCKKPPPAIELHRWNKKAFQKLFEMGFFEIVGLVQGTGRTISVSEHLKTMQIVSGTDAQGLEEASKAILELSQFISDPSPLPDEVFVALNTALSEALSNVTRWAYTEDHSFRFTHLSRWWITATADREKRTLTVVLYDQGATIPATFPRKNLHQSVKDFILRNLSLTPTFGYCDDGIYIEGATRQGRSATDRSWHGKGLPQMIDLIKICGNGSLTILSRGGMYRYDHAAGSTRESRPFSVGGTLIEWELHLPRDENDG